MDAGENVPAEVCDHDKVNNPQHRGVQTGEKRKRGKNNNNNNHCAQGDGGANWKQQGCGHVEKARVNMQAGQNRGAQ